MPIGNWLQSLDAEEAETTDTTLQKFWKQSQFLARYTRCETSWQRSWLEFERGVSSRARALVGVGSLLLEAIEAAAVRDAADSAARWKIESAVRTDEELMFFAKNGYWPEDPSLLNEVSPNEVIKPNG